MSDTATLLPSSATSFERDLSASMDSLPRVGAAAELIRNAKRENIPDSVVPWLLVEYGLGELLPYLPDPRTAISTGVLWQRLRGTPKSFEIALGWINNSGAIEESEGGSINWSQFQLGLQQAPVDLSQTDSIVEIGRLSSPVRSSLFRIYGGWYDGRRFQLDDHKLSSQDTLCDHTGVYLKDEWPQLSFGREFKKEDRNISEDLDAELGIHRANGISGRYEDRNILSNTILDEASWRTLHIEDLASCISRLHFNEAGPWWIQGSDWEDLYAWDQVLDWAGLQNKFQPALKFARAGMYLSDYAELGDTNACLAARSLDEFGDGPVLLSEADPDTGEHILSEHLSRVEFTEINERFEHETQLGSVWLGSANNQQQVQVFRLAHGEALASTGHPNPPAYATLTSYLSHYNGTFNNRHDTSETVFGDGAGHALGNGEPFVSVATFTGQEVGFDVDSIQVDELAGTITAQKVLYRSNYIFSNYSNHSLGSVVTFPLYDADGRRQTVRFGNVQTAHYNSTAVYGGVTGVWSGDYSDDLLVGVPVELLPSHREHTRAYLYDDSFELSRSRLSEFTPLINEQAISRGHTTTAAQTEEQSDQWQDTASTWGTEATGTWETVASYFDSLSAGDTWNTETWETGEYFVNADADTWASTYSWKVFPQLEQILGFSLAGICLSETGFLSEGQGELGDTQATLSFPTSERIERSHQIEASHVGSVHLRGETSVVLKRERFATLPYFDVFVLSLTRLDEFIDLSQVTSNTRAHKTSFLQIPLQSGQWELATETWSGPDDWNTEAGWFSDTPDDSTWHNRYAWQNYPQLDQILGFSRTMVTLSENGHLSDSDGILGNTHATLSFFEDERTERSHHTTSTAHNPSGFFYHLRERFATLAYDDLFELSRTRLDEFIPLVNQQSITREHHSDGILFSLDFATWNDSSPSWGSVDWTVSGWFEASEEPNWNEARTWQKFSQFERILSFSKAHQTLSDTTAKLDDTNSVLGWPTSERFDRTYFDQATEDRQSFTTSQHTRTHQTTFALYVEPTWSDGAWAGANLAGWTTATSEWTGQASSEWGAAAWNTDEWAEGSISFWDTENWIDGDPTTWATHQMWVKIAKWQVASLLVETQHQTLV